MSSTTRTLSLITFYALLSACADERPQSAKPKLAPANIEARMPANAHQVEARGSAREQPDDARLTATAPAKPHSILDSKPQPSEVRESNAQDVVPASPEATVKKSENATSEDSMQEAVDFDRKLAPEEVLIDRFVLASGVEGREPVGESEHFTTETPKIFAFVQFANEKGAPFALRVHWEKMDGPASPYGFKLEVPTAKRYRTWSWTKIRREPGTYRAVLRTLDGQEVASKTFVIEAAGN